MKNTKKFDRSTFMFIAPGFLFFTLFIIVPTVASVYYSFTSWDGISPDVKFIGLANYKEIFTSARFGNALKNTVILTVFISIFENLFALGLALIVDNVRWGKNFFRSGFYIPVLISGIVSGFIWKIMYNYNFGTFNAVLGNLGLDSWKQDWLGNSSLTLIMIGVVLVWKGAGYYMIIYLASLQSVSTDLIEAAQIDGAGRAARFFQITLPLMKPMIFTIVVLSLLNSFKVFREAYLVSGNYPQEDIYLLQHLFNNWFLDLSVDKMAAGSVLLALVIGGFVWILQYSWEEG